MRVVDIEYPKHCCMCMVNIDDGAEEAETTATLELLGFLLSRYGVTYTHLKHTRNDFCCCTFMQDEGISVLRLHTGDCFSAFLLRFQSLHAGVINAALTVGQLYSSKKTDPRLCRTRDLFICIQLFVSSLNTVLVEY